MPKIKFDKETMDLIRLFDMVTGAATLDCVVFPNEADGGRVVFMVNYSDLPKAIGKAGINVKKLREKLSRNIDIVAYSSDLHRFIKNLLYPVRVIKIEEEVRNNGKKIVKVYVRPQDKGLAIGKNGRNIHKTNVFVKRHFDVDSVIITT